MLMLMSMSFESFEVNLEATVMRLNSLAVCLLLVHSFLDQISANDNFRKFHNHLTDYFV